MIIVSGGQTGVDRAALDAAIACGLAYTGYIPKGRKSEDGQVPLEYDKLIELPNLDYKVRTVKNIEMAELTLIIYSRNMTPGTKYTLEMCQYFSKAYWALDITKEYVPLQRTIVETSKSLRPFIKTGKLNFLNIAGSRESKAPGIYQLSFDFLCGVFKKL